MSNKKYTNPLDEAQVAEGVQLYKHDEAWLNLPKRLHAAIKLHNQLEGFNGEHLPKRLKNYHQRLRAYQEVALTFRDYSLAHLKLQKQATREASQLKEGRNTRSGKRWTDAEDNALIQQAAQGDDVQQLALHLGRSPGAVSSRISHLVGIKRISVEFAGTIKGQLNGEEVEGTFVGEVRKVS